MTRGVRRHARGDGVRYLQLVVGLSPLEAGLWSLPSAVGFILGSQVTPPGALHNVRPAWLTGGGLALAAGSVIISPGMAPVSGLTTELIVGSAPACSAMAAQLPGELGATVLQAARGAFVAGMQLSWAVAAGIGAALAVLALVMLRGQEPTAAEGEAAVATATSTGSAGDGGGR